MKTKVFLLALLIMNVFQMSAQNKDEVTLVVSASGTTTEEATKAALRSAIEQAYGAFVSANTTILNDELVKDEIVTVSNGNIKDYKEISCVDLADGRLYVTLQATVSISKLISYAKSKGAETEFAGATFGANLAMYELNKKNEQIVIENMETQLKAMTNLFDYELELENPKISGSDCIIKGKINLIYNKNTDIFNEIYMTTLTSLTIPEGEKSMGLKSYKYCFPFCRFERPTANNVKRDNLGLYKLRNNWDNKKDDEPIIGYTPSIIYFGMLKNHATKFVIADNISSPTNLKVVIDKVNTMTFFESSFPYYKEIKEKLLSLKDKKDISIKKVNLLGKKIGYINIEICIPVEYVAKYNKFEIKPIAE